MDRSVDERLGGQGHVSRIPGKYGLLNRVITTYRICQPCRRGAGGKHAINLLQSARSCTVNVSHVHLALVLIDRGYFKNDEYSL